MLQYNSVVSPVETFCLSPSLTWDNPDETDKVIY